MRVDGCAAVSSGGGDGSVEDAQVAAILPEVNPVHVHLKGPGLLVINFDLTDFTENDLK